LEIIENISGGFELKISFNKEYLNPTHARKVAIKKEPD